MIQNASTSGLNQQSQNKLPPIKIKNISQRIPIQRTYTPENQIDPSPYYNQLFQYLSLQKAHVSLGQKMKQKTQIAEDFSKIESNQIPPQTKLYRQYLHKILGKDEKTKFYKQKPAILFQKDANQIGAIKHLMSQYIAKNRKFYNVDVVKIPEYEKKAVINVNQLEFMDKLMDNIQIVNKNYGFNEQNLKRNLLGLESVVLERLLKLEQIVHKEKSMEKKFDVPNI